MPPRARPVYHARTGRFFKDLRKSQKWTQRQAALIASRQPATAILTRQRLLRLEKGQTKNPEPEVFRALAVLYDRDYEQLVGMFTRQRYGVSLQTGGQASQFKVRESTPQYPITTGEGPNVSVSIEAGALDESPDAILDHVSAELLRLGEDLEHIHSKLVAATEVTRGQAAALGALATRHREGDRTDRRPGPRTGTDET